MDVGDVLIALLNVYYSLTEAVTQHCADQEINLRPIDCQFHSLPSRPHTSSTVHLLVGHNTSNKTGL